ncbi:DUF4232 domain-containing protein [Actinoallomurus iriomotensis]|nr:DUF4232 domain-containing protein [Actinoallomurus iriomotensis]
MTRKSMWTPAALLAGIAIATTGVAGTADGATRPRSAAASAPACLKNQLEARLYDAGLVGAGNAGTMVTITNTSTTTCEISGYVVPEMQNPDYPDLPTYPQNGSTYFNDDPGVHPVRLSPGERASCVMAWGNGDSSDGVLPKTLWLWLPSDTDQYLTVPFAPGYVRAGRITVSALAAHTQLH